MARPIDMRNQEKAQYSFFYGSNSESWFGGALFAKQRFATDIVGTKESEVR